MLEEHEWDELAAFLHDFIGRIKKVREEKGLSLADAREQAGLDALHRYRELTGFVETNVNALWHHRLSLFGPPCSSCGKPLRTPRAKHCAECGVARSQ